MTVFKAAAGVRIRTKMFGTGRSLELGLLYALMENGWLVEEQKTLRCDGEGRLQVRQANYL
jgi:hypothetical protein